LTVSLLDEFIDKLRKKKVDTKSRKNMEYLDHEFIENLAIKPLLQEIEETDNMIDQMVYELYGLNEDEIKIIKESLNSGIMSNKEKREKKEEKPKPPEPKISLKAELRAGRSTVNKKKR
jgi:hypothetical protein